MNQVLIDEKNRFYQELQEFYNVYNEKKESLIAEKFTINFRNKIESQFDVLNKKNKISKLELDNYKDLVDKTLYDIWNKFIINTLDKINKSIMQKHFLNKTTERLKLNEINDKLDMDLTLIDIKKLFYKDIELLIIMIEENFKFFKWQLFFSSLFAFLGAVIGTILSNIFK